MAHKYEDVVAFLLDRGDAGVLGKVEYPDPWGGLVQALREAPPLERVSVYERVTEGQGEVKATVEAALKARFSRKQDRQGGLDEVPAAIGDAKERLDNDVLHRALEQEEDGDADVFSALYSGQAVYDHAESTWYLWNGQFWEEDRVKAVVNLIRNEVASQYGMRALGLMQANDMEHAKPYLKRMERLHTQRRKEHVLWSAAALPEMAMTGDEWDHDPWLLGTPNGVVNLRDGSFRAGQPRDFIRTVIPTTWGGLEADAPRWERFLAEIFNEDVEVVRFMHRLLGYGITGLRTEHAFPVLWGPGGRNGKTTLLETLADVLGPDVTMSIPADELMWTYHGKATGPQPYIARLRGKRIVWSSETQADRRLDAETVKKLTGGDRITAHAKYSNPIEFAPTHLLFLLTNHRPKIEAVDNAIWDRVSLIPFNVRFVDRPQAENERKRDANLQQRLLEERQGILAWLVRGCLVWQEKGQLEPPEQVLLATESYRDEEDTVSLFVEEFCVQDDNARVGHRELYKEYVRWCKDLRLYPSGSREFGATLKEKFVCKRASAGMMYYGIGLPVRGAAGQMGFDEQ